MIKLSDKEREIICKNWHNIKNHLESNELFEATIENLKFKAQIYGKDRICLIIEKTKNIFILIRKDAKIIKFKYYSNDELKEKDELIICPSYINKLVKYYKMIHPVYSDKDNDTNVSVDETKSQSIYNEPGITEIFDDRFSLYISETNFYTYINFLPSKVSENYNEFSINKYSKLVNDDNTLTSKKRSELSDLLMQYISQKIIFLIGCQKIGLTFTFLETLKFSQNFYINFEELNSLSKTTDKRKYIFQKFFCLFDNFSEYNEFINKKIFGIKGYDNMLKVITEIIEAINEYNDNNTVLGTTNIILDNYDDYLVGNSKLSVDYVDNLYKIIKKNDIRIFILGRGLHINSLLIKYFFKPYDMPPYILFKYYTSLDLNLENIIHMRNKEDNFDELGNYLKNKIQDTEYLIYKLIMIKNIPSIINEFFEEEIPFQFLKFQKDDKNLEISFQFDDLFDLNNKKIREYISKLNCFKNFSSIKNQAVKGFIFEELLVSIFMNNKGFQNLNFTLNNIVEVGQIYNMENIIPQNKIEEGPILIIQKNNGEVFDFGIVINQNNIEYFIGIQAGLNKTKEEITNYKAKLELNEEKIVNDISTLTKRKITQFRFIIILHKETQNEVKSKYDKIYEEKNNIKINTIYEKKEYESKSKKLSYFNSNYGTVCCENANISFFVFSTNDFCFYQQEKKIEDFNPESFNYIRQGLEKFCIKQYNLVPIETKNPILNEKETNLLLNTIIK